MFLLPLAGGGYEDWPPGLVAVGGGLPPPETRRQCIGFGGDFSEHAFDILDYLVVPEPDQSIAEPLDLGRSQIVLSAGVLPTIHFEDETVFGTEEVGDVGSDGCLTSEFEAAQAPAAQMMPEDCFRFSGIAAQVSRVPVGRADGQGARLWGARPSSKLC